MSAPESDGAQPRRTFVKEAAAVALGGVATLVPVATGLFVWLDPLRTEGDTGAAGFIKITSLDALPNDSIPRKWRIIGMRGPRR